MTRTQKLAALAVCAIMLAVGGTAFMYRQDIVGAYARIQRGPIPPETPLSEIVQVVPESPTHAVTMPEDAEPAKATEKRETSPVTSPIAPGLPKQMNLKVPMVFQAPFRIWDEIHEDACEEASVLMVHAYLAGETSLTPEEMDARILPLVTYQNEAFGDFKNTDAAQTAQMMREHLGMKNVQVLPVVSANDIRTQIAKGRPVIIPASGKALQNPNFRHGGPLYHMLVIKGYTADGKFVTHDPGTRLGTNYVYTEAIIMDAIHDYNGGNVEGGEKLMIVAGGR